MTNLDQAVKIKNLHQVCGVEGGILNPQNIKSGIYLRLQETDRLLSQGFLPACNLVLVKRCFLYLITNIRNTVSPHCILCGQRPRGRLLCWGVGHSFYLMYFNEANIYLTLV